MQYIKGLVHYFCFLYEQSTKAFLFPQKLWWKIAILTKVSEKIFWRQFT